MRVLRSGLGFHEGDVVGGKIHGCLYTIEVNNTLACFRVQLMSSVRDGSKCNSSLILYRVHVYQCPDLTNLYIHIDETSMYLIY